jgi:DNA-binding NtrC family response regulator
MKQKCSGLGALVVDDEEDICWALQRILEAEGHCVTTAGSAREALRLARRRAFSIAFVDIKLPDMDGFDLLARLQGLCPALYGVVISGYLCDHDLGVQTGVREGTIRAFIGKPFLLSQIREALRLAADAVQRPSSTRADGGQPGIVSTLWK